MSQHNYRNPENRNHHSTGIEIRNDMSDRYGEPKQKLETILWVKRDELTLKDLSELVTMTDNFPENTKVTVLESCIVATREPTKPVTMHHRGGEHLQWTVGVDMEDGKGTPVTTKIDQPRDHLGRFVKRD